MLVTIKELKSVFPDNMGNAAESTQIKMIQSDSRLPVEQALFIPIAGDNFDGHAYIEKAIEQGAIATLWDRSKEIPKAVSEELIFFFVEDTITALQQLAAYYREKVDPIVIGITGSNGKTTTKDLTYAVMQTTYKTHATKGNFNNHLGLPFTILQMPADTEMLVLEMGMSNFDEIDVLTKIAQPDYAIITNIGESHIEHLGSKKGIAAAKLEIMNGLKITGKLIIDGDEPLLNHVKENKHVINCGFADDNTILISDVFLQEKATNFTINKVGAFTVGLLGKHHAKNASYVWAVARDLAIPTRDFQAGLHALEPTGMRFELTEGKQGVTIINDAYNASVTSMKASIEVVKEMPGFKKKILVLGDILELGDFAESLHASVADAIDESVQHVYTFGEHAARISEQVKIIHPNIETKHFTKENQLIEKLQEEAVENQLIFFKASRGMAFERFVETIAK